MNRNIERRDISEADLAVEGGDGEPLRLVGYAAVFNTSSEPLKNKDKGVFTETVNPGAFTRSLAGADVRALFNHDRNRVLGRVSAGTLRLSEDERGLRYEIDLDDTQSNRELARAIKRKDITGSSFSFATVKDAWRVESRDLVRELREVHVLDVGPVTYPAYTNTDVAVRSLEEHLETERAESTPVTPPIPIHRQRLGRWLQKADLD